MYGELGDGTTTSRNTPTEVTGLSSGVAALSAGNDHTCGRIESGDKLTLDDRKALLDTAGKATESMREEASHAND